MQPSVKARSALRLLIDMTAYSDAGNVKVKDISRRQGISVKYLEQIVAVLSKEGFVAGERGPQGGYRLCVDPHQTTAGDVIRAVDGPVITEPEGTPSSTDDIWRRIGMSANAILDDYTLADLAESELRIQAGKGPEYLI